MKTNKIDIKTLFIIILGVALCISFWFGQKNNIDDHQEEIKNLHKENTSLLKKNDSICAVNNKIDVIIDSLNNKLVINSEELVITKKQLQDLKNKQNEIPRYVNNLSANGVAIAFSNYFTKSKGTR